MKFLSINILYFLFLLINNHRLTNSTTSLTMYNTTDKFNNINGTPTSKGEKNIVGGFYAQMGWYPYQVAVFEAQLVIVKIFHCGGSIIGYNYVLTASHCLVDRTSLTVVAGITSISKFGEVMQLRESKRLIVHPGYNHSARDSMHDIGLIVIDTPFFYNDFIKPIPLPTRKPEIGEFCVVSGWGAINKDISDYPEFLRALFVPLSDPKVCKKWHHKFFDGMICSGFVEGKDFCFGDSGGPLSCKHELQGVVSYFIAHKKHVCATGGINVYTNVTHYENWIKDHMFKYRTDNGITKTQINPVYLSILVIVGNYLNIIMYE